MVCLDAEEVDDLAKSCIDFFIRYVYFSCSSKSKTTDCANLSLSIYYEKFVKEGSQLQLYELF